MDTGFAHYKKGYLYDLPIGFAHGKEGALLAPLLGRGLLYSAVTPSPLESAGERLYSAVRPSPLGRLGGVITYYSALSPARSSPPGRYLHAGMYS